MLRNYVKCCFTLAANERMLPSLASHISEPVQADDFGFKCRSFSVYTFETGGLPLSH